MSIQPFFHELRSAYQAELDDLASDSDGRDVLRQRLVDKRKELGFLLQMIEFSPEMVAVVFHQAFTFKQPGVMAMVLGHEADELPEWDTLSEAVQLAPWAQPLADAVLKEPAGARFMTMAAALEFMHGHIAAAMCADQDGAGQDEGGDEDEQKPGAHEGDDARHPMDDDEDGLGNEEAGADWLAEQGFDRKD